MKMSAAKDGAYRDCYIDVPEEFSGTIINKLNERKGELQGMSPSSDGTVRLEYHIPSRGLIGFRGDFLTSTKGTGIMNTAFDGYALIRATCSTASWVPHCL